MAGVVRRLLAETEDDFAGAVRAILGLVEVAGGVAAFPLREMLL